MEFDELEGPAYDAFLKLIDAVKLEAARVNNMTMEAAWGKNAALELVQLIPLHLGRATINAATHYGYSYAVAVAAADGLIALAPVPPQRVIGIWGYVDSTPGLPTSDQLDITIGSRLSRQWPMKPAQSQLNNTANRLDPVLIPSTKNLTITNACHLAGGLNLTFLGVFAQPKS